MMRYCTFCLDPITQNGPVDGQWIWPLPRLGRNPIAKRISDRMLAVDISYPDPQCPDQLFVDVHAAQAGLVSFAAQTGHGFTVSLEHDGWTTHYDHLDRLFVDPTLGRRQRRRARVRRGDVIGYAAQSPLHIRFGLCRWTDEHAYVPADPVAHMKDWVVTPTADDFRRIMHAAGGAA